MRKWWCTCIINFVCMRWEKRKWIWFLQQQNAKCRIFTHHTTRYPFAEWRNTSWYRTTLVWRRPCRRRAMSWAKRLHVTTTYMHFRSITWSIFASRRASLPALTFSHWVCFNTSFALSTFLLTHIVTPCPPFCSKKIKHPTQEEDAGCTSCTNVRFAMHVEQTIPNRLACEKEVA